MRWTPERGAVAWPARAPHCYLPCIAPAEPPARSPDRSATRLRGHSARAQADQRFCVLPWGARADGLTAGVPVNASQRPLPPPPATRRRTCPATLALPSPFLTAP